MRYFETIFLDETEDFVATLDTKAIKKVLYNIDLAEQTKDPNLSKIRKVKFGSLEPSIQESKSACLHFGTRKIAKKRLYWQRTEL